MSQWGFYFDQTRCLNCKACQLACKSWNDERRGDASLNVALGWLKSDDVEVTKYENPSEYEGIEQNYAEYRKYHMKENWRRIVANEYGDVAPNVDVLNMSLSCNHCEDPACKNACPMGNIIKESKFGAVLVGDNCISCGRCKDACPWDAPQYYDDNYAAYKQADPRRPKMTKCTLCYDRINEGLKPACVAACVGRALDAGPLGELKTRHHGFVTKAEGFASDEIAATGTKTQPSIIFKTRAIKVKV